MRSAQWYRARVVGAIRVAAVALAVGGVALVASPASADQGDGSYNCNRGEICFKKDDGGPNTKLRHFWWGDMSHWDDYFTHGEGKVEDNMSSELNRDASCDVKMWDITNTGSWYVYYTAPMRPNATNYWYVGGASNDRNNGHSRCS